MSAPDHSLHHQAERAALPVHQGADADDLRLAQRVMRQALDAIVSLLEGGSPMVSATHESVAAIADLPPVMTVGEVSRYLNVNDVTIRRMVKDGDLPHARLGGPRGALRFRREDVLNLFRHPVTPGIGGDARAYIDDMFGAD